MVLHFFHSYVLWITYLFSNIDTILGHTELTTSMNNNSKFTQWLSIFCFLFVSITFGIFISTLINYYQLHNVISIIKSSKHELLNKCTKNFEVKKHKEKNNLSDFIPLTPNKLFYIHHGISHTIVEDLIILAKETKTFTISLYGVILLDEPRFIELEFIHESQSIIAKIEIFRESTVLYARIRHLLSIIFDSSNIIQTWGDINVWLGDQDYGFVFENNIDKTRFLNIQRAFKIWYNLTFRHNDNCGQILDFHDMDGPLCSCSYRPYKCSKDTWSLYTAIMYTFHENIYDKNANIHECLAITTLATVIQEKWTREQVKNYIKEHHTDY